MRTSHIVFVNFGVILGLILVIAAVYNQVPRPKEHEILNEIESLESLLQKYEKPRLSIRLKGLREGQKSEYEKLLSDEIYNVLKDSRFQLKNNTSGDDNQESLDNAHEFTLSIECKRHEGNENQGSFTIKAFNELHVSLNCESLSSKATIQKSVRQIRMLLNDLAMFSVEDDRLTEYRDNYYFDIRLIELNSLGTTKSNDLFGAFQKGIQALASKIDKELLGGKRIHLNFDRHHQQYLKSVIQNRNSENTTSSILFEDLIRWSSIAKSNDRVYNNWQSNEHITLYVYHTNGIDEGIEFNQGKYTFVEVGENVYAFVIGRANKPDSFLLDIVHLFERVFNLRAFQKQIERVEPLKLENYEKSVGALSIEFLKKHAFFSQIKKVREVIKILKYILNDSELEFKESLIQKVRSPLRKLSLTYNRPLHSCRR